MKNNKIKKEKPKRIVYAGIVGDLFHYGHLQLLKSAKSYGNLLICGVITDKGVSEYRETPIVNLKERLATVLSINCVDQAMVQKTRDPTENLKKLHQKFPNSKLILVHGTDWKEVPGSEYIEKISGELKQPSYYKRLSIPAIINSLMKNQDIHSTEFDFFTDYFRVKDIVYFDHHEPKKGIISTKAKTLKALAPSLKKSKIEKMFVFTEEDWETHREELLDELTHVFPSGKVVVRSSAVNEDTFQNSMAGHFHTELNTQPKNKVELKKAVEKVIKSYSKNNAKNPENTVLIQKQTENIKCSGVVFTRSLSNLSPYYIINYDNQSGKTDTVTAGKANKTITISRFTEQKNTPKKWHSLMDAVKEIEEIIPDIPLDIEFAQTEKNQIIIFQVRPIVAKRLDWKKFDQKIKDKIEEMQGEFSKLSKKNPRLAGNTTFLADMSDWNPAEIIGHKPNNLDISLYAELIMNSAWHEARTAQGYYDVNPAKLMVCMGGKPYVNVRNTFNSFTPTEISQKLRAKLIRFYLEKLKRNPHLQDKVEFDVLFTVYDLNFRKRAKELESAGFSKNEIASLKQALLKLTNRLVCDYEENIQKDLDEVLLIESKRIQVEKRKKSTKNYKKLTKFAFELIKECREHGTVQFSRLARLGFVGKIILKSLVSSDQISQEFYHGFLTSIETVATEMKKDFFLLESGKLSKKEFLKKYNHLRPGTYDITAPRYGKNPSLLSTQKKKKSINKQKKFKPKKKELKKITHTLKEHGFEFDAGTLLSFTKKALEAREFSKFEFTKSLSDSIELIAEAGQSMGFLRYELAMLDLKTLKETLDEKPAKIKKTLRSNINSKQREREIIERIILPPVIFSEKDFEIIIYYASHPNFITKKRVEANTVQLTEIGEKVPKIKGKIVLIENADPGYDWIFTRNPRGLITKYGGTASHMSIRCAEFGLPAAIGCGEHIFKLAKESKKVLLDCEKGIIRGK